MTSPFGKFLAPVTVPTGGWDFVNNADTFTIPAGTYATILHVLAALDVEFSEEDGGDISVSEAGIVSIQYTGMTSVTWASCSDDLLTLLGFEEDEAVSSETVTATNPHTHGWYPGTITKGSTGGVGLSDDTGWVPEDLVEGVVSGAGSQALVGPDRDIWTRTLTFEVIDRDEKVHATRGPTCLARVDKWRLKDIYWYPDRSVGDVDDYGTQGDPADDDTDADCDYYIVTVSGRPRFQRHATHPDYFTFQLSLNAEPD